MTSTKALEKLKASLDKAEVKTYCVSPSCSFVAEGGSQHCARHNGKKVEWKHGPKVAIGVQRVGKAVASDIAKARKQAWGWCVFQPSVFVGPVQELEKIGVIIEEDFSS